MRAFQSSIETDLTVTGSSEDPYMYGNRMLDRRQILRQSVFSLRDTVFSENPVTAGAAVTGFSEN